MPKRKSDSSGNDVSKNKKTKMIPKGYSGPPGAAGRMSAPQSNFSKVLNRGEGSGTFVRTATRISSGLRGMGR